MCNEWIVDKLWKEKLQGDVWIVHNESGQRGYFKVPGRNPYYGGTMIANEIVAASLARILDFPVADVLVTKLRHPDGQEWAGVLSIQKEASELLTWQETSAAVKANPSLHVRNMQRLRELVVFDAWILNTDRGAGKNLILHRDSGEEKYDWYLIDHGNTLYGSPYRWRIAHWRSRHWDYLWRYSRVPQGLLKEQSDIKLLTPMIKRIQTISTSTIRDVVGQVSPAFLPKYERRVMLWLLLRRQEKLYRVMSRWVKYRGKKEKIDT